MSKTLNRLNALTYSLAAMLLVLTQVGAQQTTLTLPAQRISDSLIQQDYTAFETLQQRIKGVNDKGRPVRDYHLSKAQCWLDVSLHEYTRNDRSAFVQEAMTESEKLIVRMEQASSPAPLAGPWDTPLVNGSARLRPDLWARAEALKQHAGFACAAQRTACAEVELVHAGNEYNQQQWRHAKPYVQIAEDQLLEAEGQAARCAPAVAPATPAPAPVAAPPVAAVPASVEIVAEVVFNFDRYTADQMRPESRAQLDAVRRRLLAGLKVERVKLIGHADRLNHTGNPHYNETLSERRAQTVRDVLIKAGLHGDIISYEYRGDTEQVEACREKFASQAALESCLLPNRRVSIQFFGAR